MVSRCGARDGLSQQQSMTLRRALLWLLLGFCNANTLKPEPIVSLRDHGCLQALSVLKSSGGGTLLVPRGVWPCPPMNLTSNTVVYLERGAILKADVTAPWPTLAPLPNYRVSHDHPLQGKPRLAPFIGGFNVENVTIRGENGTIDGSGHFWYKKGNYGKDEPWTRPSLYEPVWSSNLVLEDVTFANSSFWTVHPVLSSNFRASRISIINPTTGDPLLVPNTDGFDPDSTSNVVLEDSYIAVNDDAVAIKAGWDCAGYEGKSAMPSNNITIRNLTVWRGGGGISIGSEMSGGVSDMRVSDVILQHGSYGIEIKTGDTRGGYIRNVTIENVSIVNALKKAVSIDAFYGFPNPICGKPPPVVPTIVDGITIANVVSRLSNLSLHLAGLQARPTRNIRLVNVTFDDDSFADCRGWVSGSAENVHPVPPPSCGLRPLMHVHGVQQRRAGRPSLSPP